MHAEQLTGLVQSGGVCSDIRPEHLGPNRILPAWATPSVVAAARKAIAAETPFEVLAPHLEKLVGSAYGEHVIVERLPVNDQGSYQACVPTAVVDAAEIMRGVADPETVIQLSRMFPWWICRWLQGTNGQNVGTQNQLAMYVLLTFGVCPEEMYPYVAANAYAEPTLDCWTVARSNRLTAFSPVSDIGGALCDKLELSVRADHPYVFSTGVGQEFMYWKAGDDALRPPDEVEGLHDLVGTGVRGTYPDRDFRIRNSYGRIYGEDGHCWMHESYLTASYSSGFHVGTQMPALRLG